MKVCQRIKWAGHFDALARRQFHLRSDEIPLAVLPANFHADGLFGFTFQHQLPERDPRVGLGPLFWKGVDHESGLPSVTCFLDFLPGGRD
jgi:hypothetical protein